MRGDGCSGVSAGVVSCRLLWLLVCEKPNPVGGLWREPVRPVGCGVWVDGGGAWEMCDVALVEYARECGCGAWEMCGALVGM